MNPHNEYASWLAVSVFNINHTKQRQDNKLRISYLFWKRFSKKSQSEQTTQHAVEFF